MWHSLFTGTSHPANICCMFYLDCWLDAFDPFLTGLELIYHTETFQIITKCYCRQASHDQRDIREISRDMCVCVCVQAHIYCIYPTIKAHIYILVYTHDWMDDCVLIVFWVSVFLRFRTSDCFGCFVQWNVVSLPKCGGCPGNQGVSPTGHSQRYHCTAGTVLGHIRGCFVCMSWVWTQPF